MKNKLIKSFVTLAPVLLPLMTLAQRRPIFGSPTLVVQRRATGAFGLCEIVRILDNFIGWAQVILFSVAVIMALYAAFLFITSGTAGEKEDSVSKARKTLIYAAVGVAVALLAYTIVPIVSNLLNLPFEACP